MPAGSPTTNHRITKACARCRQKKIRCDLHFPVCGACTRARTNCVGYDTVEKRERPRSTVAHLENRIAELEIELSRVKAESHADPAETVNAAINSISHRLARAIARPPMPSQCSTILATREPLPSANLLLSLTSSTFLSPSPLPFLQVRQVGQDRQSHSGAGTNRSSTIASIPRHVVDLMLKNYTDIYLAQNPFLEEAQLYESCEKVFSHDRERGASHFDFFSVSIALAISATTLIRHDEGRATAAAEEFWNTAKKHLAYVDSDQPLNRLRALQLMAHYGLLNPGAVDNWACSGAAFRLCIQLGLHEELPEEQKAQMGEAVVNLRRKRFWATYGLAGQIQFVLCRPFMLSRSEITAIYPEPKVSNQGGETATGLDPSAPHIWTVRQLETEVTQTLYHTSLSKYASSLPHDSPEALYAWHRMAHQRLEKWYAEPQLSGDPRFIEKIEFRDVMYYMLLFRLNKPSPRFPNPTLEMRKTSLRAIIALTTIYARHLRSGKLFYIWYAFHCLVESGITLMESILSGISLQFESAHLKDVDGGILVQTMRAIPLVLRKVSTRWPQSTQHAEYYEELSAPVLDCLLRWSRGQSSPTASVDPTLLPRLRHILLPGIDQGVSPDSGEDHHSLNMLVAASNHQQLGEDDVWLSGQPGYSPETQFPPMEASTSVNSDDMNWDFAGLDLDQIFAAIHEGRNFLPSFST